MPTIGHSYARSGSYSVTLTLTNASGTSTTQVFTGQTMSNNGGPSATVTHVVTVGAPPGTGYWLVGSDGGAFSFGSPFYGSEGGLKLNQPVVAMTSTADGKGYWFAARDGGVFAYGDGAFLGSLPALGVHVTNIVGLSTDAATGGYWLVGSDGGVYAFGSPFEGSIPALGQHVNDVVGIAGTADGRRYYLVSSAGAVYAFGDAKYQGGANTLPHLNAPIVGLTVDSATGGYWEAGSDGGIYAYGAPSKVQRAVPSSTSPSSALTPPQPGRATTSSPPTVVCSPTTHLSSDPWAAHTSMHQSWGSR